ncbi:MAG TPA: hypothetical protein VNC16_00190 [Solirubrobacterales bacterium]|jgi:hypothetical protein|nr:hypothetical protein [Solirubrobacterales bacterium]
MTGRREMGRNRATRALVALVAAVTCLGGVAYATTLSERSRPHGKKAKHPPRKQGQGPPRPRFIEVPPDGGVDPDSQFRFHVAPPEQRAAAPGPGPGGPQPAQWRRFECRLDGSEWDGCASPYLVRSLEPGDHSFAVRALNRRGLVGAVAHYRWALLEPREFTVEPLTGALEELMPGAPAQQLPVRIVNPNPAPIEVTSLTVTVSPEPSACPGDPNFAVMPSSLSPEAPLSVPAGGSASLPTATATAPSVAMRELPIDQNACQGATVRLDFSGEARG